MSEKDDTAVPIDPNILLIGTLTKCVLELSIAVRAIVDCEPDQVVLGKLDAIDHVLRTYLP
jgi:hypothetical protein